ncbi:restriction endonuclease subunit S [uncultured Collinsella sp.]|uniref:restriction endonuclease subunit S n=1 Tax=uncultured Collinsella sp. TaxID=165190 RepID=UPI0025DDA746|nr:restriction endonuclease subunit S [uncultured Collinsella sp.]
MPANKPPFDGERVKLGELISKAPIERCGDGKYPVYSMTMRDGIVEQAGRFKKTIASKDTSSYKVVKKNQLVVGFPIDEGVIYVQHHDVPGIMSPAYNVWNINLGRVDPSYLEFALHSPRSMAYYADKMRGTTARRRTLTADGLREMEILLPSVDEQVRVVNTLDEVRSLIKEANGQIAMLDTLVKSRFVEMFGSLSSGYKYETRKLGTLLSVNPQNGLYKPQKFYIGEGGVPIVRVDAFQAGYIESYENLRRLECSESEIEIYSLRENDIVINRVNGSIERVGKIAWIYGLVEPTVFESNMMRFHVDESRLDLAYITAFLNSSDIREQIKSRARIANQCSINQGNVADLDIPLPPLALQQEFAAFVAEVDKSRFVVQQKIEKLQMLYDSLAQEYFG